MSSASHRSEAKVSGVFARLGFQTATDDEALAFADCDGLDYDYRHGLRMDEVKTREETDGMMEGDSHYQRHGFGPSGSRKNSDSRDLKEAEDKRKITAWDAGWNVTNAIQVHGSSSKEFSSRFEKKSINNYFCLFYLTKLIKMKFMS